MKKGPAESPVTKQGVRNLNLVGSRPRPNHVKPIYHHSCTERTTQVIGYDRDGFEVVVGWRCVICGREI